MSKPKQRHPLSPLPLWNWQLDSLDDVNGNVPFLSGSIKAKTEDAESGKQVYIGAHQRLHDFDLVNSFGTACFVNDRRIFPPVA